MDSNQSVLKDFKLCLLGESGAGKSCLALRFVRGTYEEYSTATIGASFLSKVIHAQDGDSFKFQIWDTAGTEKYRSLAAMYYRGAAAAIVVYDITTESSFENVKGWIRELEQKGSSDIILAIVGNKADLEAKRVISTQGGQDLADENGAIFTECSALSGQNVNEVFEEIGKRLLQQFNSAPTTSDARTENVKLTNKQRVPGNRSKCC